MKTYLTMVLVMERKASVPIFVLMFHQKVDQMEGDQMSLRLFRGRGRGRHRRSGHVSVDYRGGINHRIEVAEDGGADDVD